MSQRVAANISGPRYFRADVLMTDTEDAVDVEPALCAVVTAAEEDEKCIMSVKFEMDDCTDNPSSRPGKHGKEFVPGPAYSRKCVAARVAARQRAIDLVGVVDGFEGNFGRLWRTDLRILNDDRCVPILWITTVTGLKFY